MKITWIGHSCFKIETAAGSVVFDPYQDGSVPGYGNVREEADMVICSHEHSDHNARECVTLSGSGKCTGLKITQLETYHDDQKGALRGKNVMTLIDDGECSLAHLGDLGCDLTEEEKKVLSAADAVLIPVGGYYTIDGKKAAQIVAEIRPKLVVPMHFSNEKKGLGYPVITSEKVFLEELAKTDAEMTVTYAGKCSAGSSCRGVVVLEAKAAE